MSRLAMPIAAVALALIAAPSAAASDSMSSPTPLVGGTPVQELTNAYSTEPGEANTAAPFTNRCGVGVARTAWYSITGNGGPVTVTTAGSAFDTALFVYAGSPGGAVVACDDDINALDQASLITFPSTEGISYAIQVGSSCYTTPCSAFGGLLRIVATLGAPNHDLDGDGTIGSQFGGPDCNDDDARIRPGALDTPGDGVDQNCDGHDAVAPPGKMNARVTLTSHRHKTYTQVAKLTAWSVPAGATVTVSCTSRKLGCRFSSKTASTKVAKTLGLGKIVGKSLTRAKLRKGAKIEVRITSAGQIGTVTRFTFRKGKTPTKATLCLPPGATKPQKVCS
jgi:hypothetical protein